MHVLATCNLLAAAAAFAVATWPHAALARDLPAPQQASPEVSGSSEEVTPVYFGNGCFWGRQHDFIETEKKLGRGPTTLSSLAAYAGGQSGAGPGNKVCYYYGNDAVYEELGHAEVVSMELRGSSRKVEEQMRAFADTYFKQFRKTPFGMIRSDPQDMGPAYRNVVGLPGGVRSPLFKVLQAENKYGMDLIESKGDVVQNGKHAENDKPAATMFPVYIVDSSELPAYKAEVYHQFHNGIGKAYPSSYTQGLRESFLKDGRLRPSGCPELRF
eukprot:jgi/Astpho2/5116/Aster-06327